MDTARVTRSRAVVRAVGLEDAAALRSIDAGRDMLARTLGEIENAMGR